MMKAKKNQRRVICYLPLVLFLLMIIALIPTSSNTYECF